MSNSRGEVVLDLCIAFGAIDTLAVGLRLLARWKSNASFAKDDWLLVGSLAPLYAMITSSFLLVKWGHLGVPAASLAPATVSTFLKILMSTAVTYALTITSVKLSLLLLYRRVFTSESFRRRSLVAGAACVVWLLAEVCAGILQCRPFHAAFDPELLFTDRCIDLRAYYWGITAANVVLDIVLICLPIREVWQLQISLRGRIGLIGVFVLGGLSCFAGVMRIVAIRDLHKHDITGSLSAEYTWSQIEPALAILSASAISYRPLLQGVKIPKLFSDQPRRFPKIKNIDHPMDRACIDIEHAPAARVRHPAYDLENQSSPKDRLRGQYPTANLYEIPLRPLKNRVHFLETGKGPERAAPIIMVHKNNRPIYMYAVK